MAASKKKKQKATAPKTSKRRLHPSPRSKKEGKRGISKAASSKIPTRGRSLRSESVKRSAPPKAAKTSSRQGSSTATTGRKATPTKSTGRKQRGTSPSRSKAETEALVQRRIKAAVTRAVAKEAFRQDQIRKLDKNRKAREKRESVKYEAAIQKPASPEALRRKAWEEKRDARKREEKREIQAKKDKRDKARDRRIAKLPPRARKKAREAYEKKDRSDRSKRGWGSRRVTAAREQILGSFEGGRGLHGSVRTDWYVLKAKREAKDPDWLRFVAACEAEGWSDREIADEWFSPEM